MAGGEKHSAPGNITGRENGNRVWITECPRDAMQGLQDFIATDTKIDYLNTLLDTGFDRLDFGSFVSPKAIPQMRDTSSVLEKLKLSEGTQLLAIVANERGAETACDYDRIALIGYPFSVSETFQQRNTNSGIADSFETVKRMLDISAKSSKELLVYISMAFGNPYQDPWNSDIVIGWVEQLVNAGVKKIALADTIGVASPGDVAQITGAVLVEFPHIETGVHLHCRPGNWKDKVEAAFNAGCRRFDAALKGFGGCPMAKDELVGNLPTENLVQYLEGKNVETRINPIKFKEALHAASEVFMAHH